MEIIIGIIFIAIFCYPIILIIIGSANKGKNEKKYNYFHGHTEKYCMLKSCPLLEEGHGFFSGRCKAKECIYKKKKEVKK